MTDREKFSINKILNTDDKKQMKVFYKEFPFAKERPEYGIELLRKSMLEKNDENFSWALELATFFRPFSSDDILLLAQMLREEWHNDHEQIVMYIEELKTPCAIEILYEAAQMKLNYYVRDDEDYPLARRCIWALWKIGTREALDKIRLLAKFEDKVVQGFALKQLKREVDK